MKAPPTSTTGILAPRGDARAASTAGAEALSRLARLAARTLRAPAALISGPALSKPVFATATGIEIGAANGWISPNTRAICEYVIGSAQPMLLSDLSRGTIPGATGWPTSALLAYAAYPLRGTSGKITGVLCIVDGRARNWTDTDLEALREIAGAIETVPPFAAEPPLDISQRQSLKLEAVGRLAGGIAHDFNNILTAIRGHADLLLDEVADGDPRRLDLEVIRRGAERAARLTHQLLAFGRKQILQPRSLDLATLIPAWVQKYRATVDDAIALQVDIAPGIAPARGDPEQIEDAILNILANAAQAMPGGGRIAISAVNVTLDESFALSFPYRVQPGSYVRINITDEGQGMDPEILERIFEPFFTTREPPLGAGLGLSTAYGIVKQSGGYIWAESEPGQGTTMQLYLPRCTG
jgi:signal transduction histidine kinase